MERVVKGLKHPGAPTFGGSVSIRFTVGICTTATCRVSIRVVSRSLGLGFRVAGFAGSTVWNPARNPTFLGSFRALAGGKISKPLGSNRNTMFCIPVIELISKSTRAWHLVSTRPFYRSITITLNGSLLFLKGPSTG